MKDEKGDVNHVAESKKIGAEKLPGELTDEEFKFYNDECARLAIKHGVSKVHSVVSFDKETNKRRVCYLKEPNYDTKILIMDKAMTIGVYSAANSLRIACVLKEESDPITYGDSPECDSYKLAATDESLLMTNRVIDQFKKKSKTMK